ncbi:histidinol dehydrogenase [Brachybacterium saurashtrense]|uniref:Histidinol dehydrogenase n=1 Tax=Brachybacterium saurashtrense TaxID=556288 RepID=A0A345YNY3_9MICO|nr:histidinol dehydrogenase [Brachybacterium saurashtrense]AXK45635.1 histidinol dehydrogenase [Brachybacterium saurashtrense]RRR24652.1 histidinol dehydrogenase [Brachybacterium saurashtrense]
MSAPAPFLATTDLRARTLTVAELTAALPRAALDVDAAADAVRPVVEAVAARGAEAVLEASERFDGIRPEHLRVPQEALDRALAELDPAIRAALEESIARVRRVDAAQVRRDETVQVVPGGTVTQRWVPVRRVGLYVPGGRAVLPSSVVMNVVPAQTAGVEQIVLASPPQKEFGGLPHPTILAACALLGVTEVLAAGGAQAIALLAHGAEDLGDGTALAGVDLVTGPGNVYVAAAKRLVRGRVGIDAEAGPTEIAILADHTADPAFVAADLISQAEHDPLAASVLVTDSPALVEAVEAELAAQVPAAAHHERIATSLRGEQSGAVLVADLAQGLAVVDAYGAEHLEIHTEHAAEVAARVTNAGAVFVGPHSPVSLGDYAAGSNHVLPTGGTSRFTGGLGVQTFLRGIHVVQYDRDALAGARDAATALAHAEGLPSHGDAIDVRFRR